MPDSLHPFFKRPLWLYDAMAQKRYLGKYSDKFFQGEGRTLAYRTPDGILWDRTMARRMADLMLRKSTENPDGSRGPGQPCTPGQITKLAKRPPFADVVVGNLYPQPTPTRDAAKRGGLSCIPCDGQRYLVTYGPDMLFVDGSSRKMRVDDVTGEEFPTGSLLGPPGPTRPTESWRYPIRATGMRMPDGGPFKWNRTRSEWVNDHMDGDLRRRLNKWAGNPSEGWPYRSDPDTARAEIDALSQWSGPKSTGDVKCCTSKAACMGPTSVDSSGGPRDGLPTDEWVVDKRTTIKVEEGGGEQSFNYSSSTPNWVAEAANSPVAACFEAVFICTKMVTVPGAVSSQPGDGGAPKEGGLETKSVEIQDDSVSPENHAELSMAEQASLGDMWGAELARFATTRLPHDHGMT